MPGTGPIALLEVLLADQLLVEVPRVWRKVLPCLKTMSGADEIVAQRVDDGQSDEEEDEEAPPDEESPHVFACRRSSSNQRRAHHQEERRRQHVVVAQHPGQSHRQVDESSEVWTSSWQRSVQTD